MEKNDKFSVERMQDVLKGKCKSGMLTYKYPELDNPEVMEAIHPFLLQSRFQKPE